MEADPTKAYNQDDATVRRRLIREKFKRVLVSPKILVDGVSQDEKLRRFIDLPKLFDLLKNQRLVLPKLKKLIEGDPFECSARKKLDGFGDEQLKEQAKQLEEFAPESAKEFPYFSESTIPVFGQQISDMSPEELKKAVWYLERERLKEKLVCSCWHKGTRESDAMWKIYAPQMGVSISSSAARMQSSITLVTPKFCAESIQLKLAAMNYGDTEECKDHEPWLIKRMAFEHEKEVRLYCDVPFMFENHIEVKIDIQKFIEEIVITPFVPRWQLSGMQGAIEALLKEVGASQIPVGQSKHMRAPDIGWPPDQKLLYEGFSSYLNKQSD